MLHIITFPQWDIDLFNAINAKHIAWLDPIMIFLSSGWSWILLFIIVSIFMLKRSKYWGTREILLIIATVGFNSVANNIIKMIVKRPRPCQNDLLSDSIRVLEDCGTNYSFFSAHSSNAFCLAICTALFFKNKYYSIFIFTWAIIVAYSRIYVGKHYPLDILVGIAFGVLVSIIGNFFLKRFREDKQLDAKKSNVPL